MLLIALLDSLLGKATLWRRVLNGATAGFLIGVALGWAMQVSLPWYLFLTVFAVVAAIAIEVEHRMERRIRNES